MENQNQTLDKSYKNNKFFYWIIIFLFFHFLFSIGIDWSQYSQHLDLNIPSWYFYIVFAVDILAILSLVLIAMYKKAGVFLFPLFILAHFTVHHMFLSTFLYFDVSVLFFFIGLGLLEIIPRWNQFK